MEKCNGCELNCAEFMSMTLDDDELWQYLISHEPFRENMACETCGRILTTNDRQSFRCQASYYDSSKHKRKCGFFKSVNDSTFFEKTKLSRRTVLQFVYHWITRNSPRQEYITEDLKMSSETVVDWSSYCREILVEWVFERSKSIGGPGVIVELDEAKFGKRKYNRGRHIEGQWIFGALERENPTNCFYVAVPDRTKDTLLRIIKEMILPATIIMSDCWKSYDCLENEGYEHLRVNHSVTFVDPDTGAHTQNIERSWRNARDKVPRYGRKESHFEGYLAEFVFKTVFPRYNSRLHAFFEQASKVYPGHPM